MTYNNKEFFEKIKNDREVAVFLLGAQLDYKENKKEDAFYIEKMRKFLNSKGIENEPIKITKRPFGYVFNFGAKKVKLQLENVKGNTYRIVSK